MRINGQISMKVCYHKIISLLFFLDGADFLCPKARSTVMFFQCGPKNKLMYVQELSPCSYKYSIDVKCSGVSMFRNDINFVS